MAINIPKIDISPLLDSHSSAQDKQRVATDLLDAFTRYGVFYITSPSHPLFQTASSEAILDATKSLFALDNAHKDTFPLIQPGGFTRGYVPIGGESGSKTRELKEGFSYGYEWGPGALDQQKARQGGRLNGLQGPNAWPSEEVLRELDNNKTPGAFKEALNGFYNHVCDVASALLTGISLAAGQPESTLAQYCGQSNTISFMRLFHYFPYVSTPGDTQHSATIGSSAHTDWGFLTLILSPCKTVGLQLYYEGEWHDVPSVDNTLIVNGGDFLSLLTGGKFISPLHRVVSNGEQERYSMCCFYYPDYDARIPRLVPESETRGQAAKASYSLLRDQRDSASPSPSSPSGATADGQELARKLLSGEINFGDYIVDKWTQVYRKGGSY
ncbi:hypothetical protein DFQ27_006142 [Actinomortierella ambigua]|uniref:Fe2OG dioxygenase domain-containing protein n=1 Tax=Actinomortierella ambigua TaxID=1343610 RepID=A0A9P6QH26_9FUNG|nr:hypothetical protein DFQ27_006142 [Actinomortierella ambigua]